MSLFKPHSLQLAVLNISYTVFKSSRDCRQPPLDMGEGKGFTPPLWYPAPNVKHHLSHPDLLEHCNSLLMTEPMQCLAIHGQDLIACNTNNRVTSCCSKEGVFLTCSDYTLLLNQKFHRCPRLHPVLCHMNLAHAFTSCCSKIHFNMMFPLHLGLSCARVSWPKFFILPIHANLILCLPTHLM